MKPLNQNKMKQTAVEWLATYLKGITSLNCDEVIDQAKEMEKEQIMEAFEDGACSEYPDHICKAKMGEQYYNETYL
jgi:hypothetical protein